MIVLGLGGKPRSGKTTAADAIVERWREAARMYSISDLICAELGVKREDVRDARVLQDHGQRQRERFGELYWSDKIKSLIENERPCIVVIPNVRTLSEVALVRYFGGYLIRYTRLDVDGSEYQAHDRDMNHRLETELDDFNWDFYLTARFGQSRLIGMQTVTLVRFLMETGRGDAKTTHT